MQSKTGKKGRSDAQAESSPADEKRQHAIFNGKYEILSSLGHGKTSKVYLAVDLEDPSKTVALKIFKQEYLFETDDNIHSIEHEIEILKGLNHDRIVNILDYGSEGHVLKPSGREIKNMVYLVLERVHGGLLYDLCEK